MIKNDSSKPAEHRWFLLLISEYGGKNMADTTNITQEAQQEQEMKNAQETGVVDFNKKKKEESMNYTHEFSEPVEIAGKKYKSLTFYFEDLTGEDIEAVEEELQDQNKYVVTPEVSSAFQCILAAKAAGIGSDEIRRLKIKDYMRIKNKARDFLISAGY